MNDGWLLSDYPEDPTRKAGDHLTELTGPNSAQVDYVHPMANGGYNCFSNAKIASGTFNNQKKDTMHMEMVKADTVKMDTRGDLVL